MTIKNQIAIEALGNNPDTFDLELIGIEPLKDINTNLKLSIEAGGITSESTFLNVFGLDVNFFYILENIKEQTPSYYERGIGYIYQLDNKLFLKRKKVFISGKNSFECAVSIDHQPQMLYSDKALIYSSIPPTYIEAIAPENCVLCSSDSCIPNPVSMIDNSLLARLDNKIESISFDDDRLVSKILNAIVTFKNQLKLKTSKLSLKRVEPEVIDMVPTSNIKAKRGSLYYDESDNKLKLYDGQSWKTVAFLED